ncbi:hypothetical protein ACFUJ0_30540 [Streptomyces sp. NPDC057242]|uniref:hypothetical protein n=1 Tax=Streptomyces TaxID=1883 RepID=UPI0035E1AE03
MNTTPDQSPDLPPNPPSTIRTPLRRRRCRSTARHFMRGLSYGTGMTLAGLLGYWFQQLL